MKIWERDEGMVRICQGTASIALKCLNFTVCGLMSFEYFFSLSSLTYWSGRNASVVLRRLLDEKHYDKRFRPDFEGVISSSHS